MNSIDPPVLRDFRGGDDPFQSVMEQSNHRDEPVTPRINGNLRIGAFYPLQ